MIPVEVADIRDILMVRYPRVAEETHLRAAWQIYEMLKDGMLNTARED